jgi:uncharacterized phage protein (predicted DNA packaging)
MVSLTEIKNHLRIDHNADDALLAVYAGAAAEYVRQVTRQDWPGEIPFSLKAAALLLIGDLYENREAQTPIASLKANETVDRLLWPFRRFS